MNRILKNTLVLFLTLMMLLPSVACGEKKEASKKTDANNDFFTDTEISTTDEDETKSDDTQTTDKFVPDENKIGGKSWKEVLASMPKNLRGTKVVLYNWNPAAEYTGAPEVLERFTKETGIKVEWMRINYSEYVTKLSALIASKESPDTVRTRLPVPERLSQFQSIDAAKYDFTDDAWDKTVMRDYTVNGVTYATSLKNTHLGSVVMMFYNKDIITKYDMEDPYTLWKNGKWTVNKFVEMCREYKKLSGNTTNAATGMTFSCWSQMYGIQGNIAFENGKWVSKMGTDNFLEITQKFADYDNVEEIFHQGRAEVMDSGEALFYAGGSVYLRKKNTYFGTLKAEGKLYVVPMPSVEGQSVYYQQRDEYEAYAIAKGAKNPEAVPYLLRYFLDGANYELDRFFCNKQNLEVYNWCMAQPNSIWSINYYGDDSEHGWYKKTGNQIKSYADSIEPLVNTKVKELNEATAKLGK